MSLPVDPPGGQKPRPTGGIVTVLFLLAGALSAAGSGAAVFSDGKAGFAVKVGEEICPYTVFGVYVLPGEQLAIEVIDPPAGERFILEAAEAAVTRSAAGAWTWTAPALAGLYTIEIHRAGTGDAIRLNAFVLVPYERLKDGYLDGYQIGSYPRRPLKDLEIYRTPRGFIEVTPEIETTPISPHFTLGEFICKQKAEYPKSVVLRERLLLKLEYLLEKANERGYRCEGFVVMSGYRTPDYNAAIGNVRYSRHQWGDAADIYIDENPKDGVMDDLNRDGRIDKRDAAALYDLIESLSGGEAYARFQGGLGSYGSTPAHGPFVHVDVRGFKARW